MPVALIAGEYECQINPCISMRDVCYLGTRSYEEAEMELLKRKNILYFTPKDCSIEKLDKIKADIEEYFFSG